MNAMTQIDVTTAIEQLRTHILAAQSQDADPVCPDCDGYGHVIGPCGARPCHCAVERNSVLALKRIDAQVLAKYKDAIWRPATLDQTKPPFQAVKDWLRDLQSRPCGLVLCGPPGIGKTTAAVYAAGQMAIAHPYWQIALWLNGTRTIRDLIFGTGDEHKRRDLIDQIYGSDALVFDDIGRSQTWSNAHERIESLLYDVTDYALGNEVPCVLVFNISKKDLIGGTQGGPLSHPRQEGAWIRNASLLSRMGSNYWKILNCTGPDMRKGY